MTLAFSTTWPKHMPEHMAGKPTFFTQKIIKGLPLEKWSKSAAYSVVNDLKSKECGYVRDYDNLKPKLHTFRADPKDLWKVGMKIHPVINNRSKNRFQFAQVLEVKAIQKIEITHIPGNVQVDIDGEFYGEADHHGLVDIYNHTVDLEKLAINDGFESVEDFFAWFNKDFTGKIIHWINLKY